MNNHDFPNIRGDPEKKKHRIKTKQLTNLSNTLSGKDRQILIFLQSCKYAYSEHIRNLFYTDSASVSTASRAANRTTKKLKELGLIQSVGRQIGGRGSGSTSFIWYLTELGYRVIGLENGTESRKRVVVPSLVFIRHTLSITETYTQIVKAISASSSVKIQKVEWEPECWRIVNKNRKETSLRPDLYLETINGEYEDRWFIEVDLDTEDIGTVCTKCRRY